MLTTAPTVNDMEDRLEHALDASSSGLNGVGYGMSKFFGSQLTSLLATVFNRCWVGKKFPQRWKVSIVQLLNNKKPIDDPTNWRSIFLHQTINKLRLAFSSSVWFSS